jgi:hypothetical protein
MKVKIASPCKADWNAMTGDERLRHCRMCKKNVYNFSGMTEAEIRSLLRQTEGEVCARIFKRADGTILTADCPVGIRATWRRRGAAVAILVATLAWLAAIGLRPKHRRGERLMGALIETPESSESFDSRK